MIEFVVPMDVGGRARELVREREGVLACWELALADGGLELFKIIVRDGYVEALTDALEAAFEHEEAFALVNLPVNAVLPKPAEPEPEEPDGDEAARDADEAEALKEKPPQRVSRAELYEAIAKGARLDRAFVASAAIASLVAAIGLTRDNPAIVIGAMVIAPLLGPHMAFALATTLGDGDLGKRSLKATLVGGGLTVGVALAAARMLPFDPAIAEIASRTTVGPGDIALALASGVAGAMAFTSGIAAPLVGVMVAVALVPPTVVACLFAARGMWPEAGGAALLVATNLVCVNLAAVMTFAMQGLRPRRWWEQAQARRATRTSIIIWVVMLAAIAGLIVVLNAWTSRPQPSDVGASASGEASPSVLSSDGAAGDPAPALGVAPGP